MGSSALGWTRYCPEQRTAGIGDPTSGHGKETRNPLWCESYLELALTQREKQTNKQTHQPFFPLMTI